MVDGDQRGVPLGEDAQGVGRRAADGDRGGDGGERSAHIVGALGAVRARMTDACTAAGRDVQPVTLIAVTKLHPAADVATLVRLGVLDIGESRDQEVRAKIAELGATAERVRWHVVGRVQTNKARSVVGYAHAVHSVDRERLVTALAQAADERAVPLEVFVQLSLDGDPSRGGAAVADLDRLADRVAERPALRLRGIMAVPPIDADPDAAFAQLQQLSQRLRDRHPTADAISAGMSADLEAALRHGSTYLRVGSALLGRRPPDLG